MSSLHVTAHAPVPATAAAYIVTVLGGGPGVRESSVPKVTGSEAGE